MADLNNDGFDDLVVDAGSKALGSEPLVKKNALNKAVVIRDTRLKSLIGIKSPSGGTTQAARILDTSKPDRLTGTSINDIIESLEGNDIIESLEGNDILIGGPGNDQFVLSPGQGTDIIVDFEDGMDSFRLEGGLGVGNINLPPPPDPDDGLQLIANGQLLAILMGINDPNLITEQDFT